MQNVNFRRDIQGLRAIAVLFVIIFHFNSELLSGGFIGVDIFLVISGYLITSIILKKKEQNNFSLKDFYLNRLKRIIPAYVTLLVAVSFCASILFIPEDYDYFRDSLISSVYFGSNSYFSAFGSYFAPNANEMPLLHTWSLAVEMQFYFLFPLFILAVPNRISTKAIGLAIVFFLLYSGYQIHIAGKTSYFSISARIPEFLTGAFIASAGRTAFLDHILRKQKHTSAAISLTLIALSLFLINSESEFPGFLAIPTCIGTAALIYIKDGPINKLLSIKPLVYIGTISYSLYLWHWPILSFIRYYTENYELSFAHSLLFIFLTMALASLSYHRIEKKFTALEKSKKATLASAAIACLITITSPVSANINKNISDPLPQHSRQYAPRNEICHGKIVGDCVRGDRSSDKEILIIGDSHAAQLNIFANIVGEENHQKYKVITASSCVTVPEFDYARLPKWAQSPCREQIKEVVNLLPKYQTIIIAGMWSYQSKSQKFILALDNFLELTSEKKIVILAQTPQLASNVLRQRRFKQLGLPQNIRREKNWDNGNHVIKALAHEHKNVVFFDWSDLNLFTDAPFYQGELIYHDKSHLNETGAKEYGRLASPYLKNI